MDELTASLIFCSSAFVLKAALSFLDRANVSMWTAATHCALNLHTLYIKRSALSLVIYLYISMQSVMAYISITFKCKDIAPLF